MNLPAYTTMQLSNVTELASLLILPRDIAIMMEIEPSQFISQLKQENSHLYVAFYRGIMQKEVDINRKYPIDDQLLYENRADVLRSLNEFKARLLIQLHYGS